MWTQSLRYYVRDPLYVLVRHPPHGHTTMAGDHTASLNQLNPARTQSLRSNTELGIKQPWGGFFVLGSEGLFPLLWLHWTMPP